MNLKRFIIAVLLLGTSVVTSIAYAQESLQPEFEMKDILVISENDVVDHDVFSFGDMTDIKGTINGDVYTAGGDVTINGQVNGDVLAAGGNVRIAPNAVIDQDVRITGGTVLIDGRVNGNITAVGGTITLSEPAQISGSFTAAGGNIRILSGIGKNLKLAGQSVYLNGAVAGGADVMVEELSFGDEASIAGNLSYMSNNEFAINEGVVTGTIQHRLPPQNAQPDKEQFRHVAGRMFTFFEFVGLIARLFIGLLFIHLFPEFSNKAAVNLKKSTWRSLGTGFLFIVLSPILILALFSTVIAIPLALMFMVGYIFALYLAPIFVMLTLGKIVAAQANKNWSDALTFVVGLLILFAVGFVPVLNMLTTIIVALLGAGVLVSTKIEVYKELRKKNLL